MCVKSNALELQQSRATPLAPVAVALEINFMLQDLPNFSSVRLCCPLIFDFMVIIRSNEECFAGSVDVSNQFGV
jgi:hypothetical protein